MSLVASIAEQSLIRIGDDLHGDAPLTTRSRLSASRRLDKLERGETGALKCRHATAFAALTGPNFDTTVVRRARLVGRSRMSTIWSAVEHLTDHGGAVADLFALWRFWHMRGHITEGRVRVDRALAMRQWTEEPTRAGLGAAPRAGWRIRR